MQTQVHRTNGKVVIRLQGRFDFSAHREFRDACNHHLENNEIQEIELDLEGVEYLDSSALGMLLLLKERAEKVSKRVLLCNCHGAVKQVLEIANFGQLFQLR